MKYYPYLRGKQFELLALRELDKFVTDADIICPVIEPIKLSRTLSLTTDCMLDHNYGFKVILNPEYGDLAGLSVKETIEQIHSFFGEKYNQIEFAVIANISKQEVSDLLDNYGRNDLTLIISKRPDNLDVLNDFIDSGKISRIIIRDELRRLVRRTDMPKIILTDPFKAKDRNKDYFEEPDEFFSDEHRFYGDDGYQGYSDFVTVGDNYSDHGFRPYAVAVHITYFDEEKNFRIYHAVSETNDDNSDTPKKFAEAVHNAMKFVNSNLLPNTVGIEELRCFDNTGDYGGLGFLKKVSLLNHFELVHKYFVG